MLAQKKVCRPTPTLHTPNPPPFTLPRPTSATVSLILMASPRLDPRFSPPPSLSPPSPPPPPLRAFHTALDTFKPPCMTGTPVCLCDELLLGPGVSFYLGRTESKLFYFFFLVSCYLVCCFVRPGVFLLGTFSCSGLPLSLEINPCKTFELGGFESVVRPPWIDVLSVEYLESRLRVAHDVSPGASPTAAPPRARLHSARSSGLDPWWGFSEGREMVGWDRADRSCYPSAHLSKFFGVLGFLRKREGKSPRS